MIRGGGGTTALVREAIHEGELARRDLTAAHRLTQIAVADREAPIEEAESQIIGSDRRVPSTRAQPAESIQVQSAESARPAASGQRAEEVLIPEILRLQDDADRYPGEVA